MGRAVRFCLTSCHSYSMLIGFASSLKLVSRWTIFTTELESVVSLSLGDDRLGRLKGSVMAVAADGTIAIIVLDGMSLWVLPDPHTF